MRSLQELGAMDTLQRGFEFVRAVKHFAAARGELEQAVILAQNSRAPEKTIALLKAAVGSGGPPGIGSPSAWGEQLVGFRQLQAGFFESLRGRSVFFRLLGDNAFLRIPALSRFGIATSN